MKRLINLGVEQIVSAYALACTTVDIKDQDFLEAFVLQVFWRSHLS